MNIYAIIILSALIIDFVLDLISNLLNLNNLRQPLPNEFKDVYTEEVYEKSAKYTTVSTKFSFISSIYGVLILLAFWFFGGFPWLENLIDPLTDSSIGKGILFIFIIMFGNSILGLPFSLYSTFVIEEKFGFNKTTAKTFILDQIKSLGLALILGVPILALVLYILENSGTNAWLIGWGTVTLVTLIIQYIAPTFIMPIFNKFKPLEEGELREKIMNFAESVKYSLKNIFVIDGSRRSSRSNAFFTGFGRKKRIALYDTLIEKHTNDELVSVLAHEIGHYKLRHILIGNILGIIHTGILFFLLSIFLYEKGMYEAFFMTGQPIYAGLLFFGMLYSPIEIILSLFFNIISRKNEYAADRFAALTTKAPENMIAALKKLSKDNLSNLVPHPFYVFLNYSHPTVLQRIEAIRNTRK
jgi:STE24 endopeptidase